jgi:Leucine-rich repeat (LRR) protein
MKKIMLGMSLLMMVILVNAAQGAIPASERQALIDLYNATNGDNWTHTTNWKSGGSFTASGTENLWYGVTIPYPYDHVTGINLSSNNLVGTLPTSIGNLPLLVSLNLHTNTIGGPIPTEIGNLVNLTVLHLYENSFTGSLPSTLGNLVHVFQLKAHTNQLSGSIPTTLGSMAALQQIELSGNLLTGSLPSEIGNLTALQLLDAHDNLLSGSLPSSMGGLTNLTSLLLNGNSFSGAIPSAWSGMTSLQLLYLDNNDLSGSIPSSWNTLIHLITLRLNDNELTGAIPSIFGGMTSLTTLDLGRNHLDGVIPASMGSLTALQNLSLSGNKLEGPVPTSLTGLTGLGNTATAIGFNALYTTDDTLRAFLNAKDPDWTATQTVAPASVTATALDNAVIMVSWIPIEFAGYAGTYKVYMSQTSGSGYSLIGQTADKSVAALNVTSLAPGQTYYFVVRAQTAVNALNPNIVESKDSNEATAIAWTQVVHLSGTVTLDGNPLAGAAMTGLPGSPMTDSAGVYTGTVVSGWSGTVMPTLFGYSFTPSSRAYSNLTTDQTGQNYTAAYTLTLLRQVLIDLYNATGGDNWTNKDNWKTPPLSTDGFAMPGTELTWHGVVLNGGGALGINLNTNNLVGTLPSSLGTLTPLSSLNVHTNSLTGPIPESLGDLPNLTVLHLYENAFTGSIPASLGNLKKVFQLKAHTNQFSGSIPAELGSMTALQWLDISGNQLSGSLPVELGNLSSLQVFDAHNNQLSGGLPDSLGYPTSLTSLILSGNSFSGAIPTTLGGLGVMEYLHLQSNHLSGSIPSSLGNLTHLVDLRLSDNELTGTIPSALGGLTALTNLNLGNNHLDGTIPTEFGSLTHLVNLALYSNKLQGPVPTSLGALTSLSTTETAIGFNALYTTDATLRTFLNAKDPDWAATQTVAPSSVTATSLDSAVIMVSWIPIDFISYTGGYKVYMSTTSGGPYNLVGQTLDKTVASMNVTSLTPGLRYYFVVRTITDPHVLDTNTVESGDSTEASAVAYMQIVHVSGTVTSSGLPLANVLMSGFTIPTVTNASGIYTGTQASGWSGTVTPVLAGYTFVPVSRTYTTVTADQAGQNYTATGSALTITVTSPNGGESWATGSTHNITWTQTGLTGTVTVDLYKGGVWQKILGTPAATAGTFSWVIATNETAGTDYRIRIWQTGASDDSNANFALVRTVKVDFDKDGHEDLLWRYYGPGGYNRAWFLGNSEGVTLPLTLSAPQTVMGSPRISMRTVSDPRDLGVILGQQDKLSGKRAEDAMGTQDIRVASVDDPRKAGPLKSGAEDHSLAPRVADPRQVRFALDAGTTSDARASIMATILLGGGDVMAVDDVNWQIVGTGDFNNDTSVDILWRNISSGSNVVWYMNGTAWSGSAELIPVADLSWQIVGTGDFNNDTHVDILWRNSVSGSNVVWYMNGAQWIGSAEVLGVSDPNWQIVGAADFNKDGNVDILWRYNGSGGYNVVWYLNNAAWTGSVELIPVGDLSWQIMGTGDYDNDGNIDILWRYNGAGGAVYIWYMNGTQWIGGEALLPVADLNWKIVNR